MASKSAEVLFQEHIINQLEKQGWLVGHTDHYDKERALYPEDLIGFIQETQPKEWQKFATIFPNETTYHFLNMVKRHLEQYDTLWCLRHQLADRGVKFTLCSFMPDHELNPDTLLNYQKNRLRVVPELIYSPHGYDGRIDLVLFVNGLPVATLELKSAFKQSIDAAILQYKRDRPPKTLGKEEPLLTFKRGALVYFALDQHEIYMTTKLAKEKTFFLPFNKGTAEGGKGNEQPIQGYATSYLWDEILQKDNWLLILGRYLHLEIKQERDALGRPYTKESLIFPRYHQWDALQLLLKTVQEEQAGKKYLIQHSAGSGKSNSIAWLAHQLATLYKAAGEKFFDSVIVITDRTVLDDQLQNTICQFEHKAGVICRVTDEESGSKSGQLAYALTEKTPIIIVTIQTFTYVLEAIKKTKGLNGRSFAVIADEAHSGQSGKTANKLRKLLTGKEQTEEEPEEIDNEDALFATVNDEKVPAKISYFAFTATPKAKTLELFGRRPNLKEPASDNNKPVPFHVYSMRQAIEEEFILDVLKNYTSFEVAYKLANAKEVDDKVDVKKAKAKINSWFNSHPHNIEQKVEVIAEHFHHNIELLLNGEAKAMVVTSGRLQAVKYKKAFDEYVKAKGYDIKSLVAFSGEVSYKGEKYTENSMNPELKHEKDLKELFDKPEYNNKVLIVANKYQTGFDQPKLVAMYVDRKLADVDCVQTLSRLNRTYPGKDNTYILDFINDPNDVLDAFKEYYKTAKLATVTDPNLIYTLFHKLNSQQIYMWSEVENFTEAYNDPKQTEDALTLHCKPALKRYRDRYKFIMESLREASQNLDYANKQRDKEQIAKAELSIKEINKAKAELDNFKKDLASFCRFYEFIAQIIDIDDDKELSALTLYASHLHPLLREERLDEDIDLSQLQLTHYKLIEKRTQDLNLKDREAKGLRGVTSIGTGSTDRTKDNLSHILDTINQRFGQQTTEDDKIAWLDSVTAEVVKNEQVMDQIKNNPIEQILKGDFIHVLEGAVIDMLSSKYGDQSNAFLNDKELEELVRQYVLNKILKGLENNRR